MFATVQALKHAGGRASAHDILKSFEHGMLCKSKAPSVQRILHFFPLCESILEVLPGADPSWGVLKAGAKAFLQALAKKDGKDTARAWDERILADQFAALLFHLRKTLRSPDLVAKAGAGFEDPEALEQLHTLLGLYQEEEPLDQEAPR